MKAFIALFAVAIIASAQAASLTAEQSAKLAGYYKDCIASSKASKDLVNKARSGEFGDEPELDNFFTCMFEKVNFIDQDGKLKVDVIKAKVPSDISKEDVDKVLTACAKFQTEAKEKVSKLVYKCYLTETPVKIQLFGVAA